MRWPICSPVTAVKHVTSHLRPSSTSAGQNETHHINVFHAESITMHTDICKEETKTSSDDSIYTLEIRSVERGICPIATSTINERTVPYGRMYGAWTRGLYFNFRSKIWCHHRVPRPRFPFRRGNFGDSAINKRYIAYFSLRMRETAVLPLPV